MKIILFCALLVVATGCERHEKFTDHMDPPANQNYSQNEPDALLEFTRAFAGKWLQECQNSVSGSYQRSYTFWDTSSGGQEEDYFYEKRDCEGRTQHQTLSFAITPIGKAAHRNQVVASYFVKLHYFILTEGMISSKYLDFSVHSANAALRITVATQYIYRGGKEVPGDPATFDKPSNFEKVSP